MSAEKVLSSVKVFPNLAPIKKYMHYEYKDMVEEKSDRVTIISGYEGSGKSYLEMDLYEYWYKKVLKIGLGNKEKELFCTTNEDWAKGLVYVKNHPYHRLTHDEGVILVYSKDATTKKNKVINKAFKQIRGKRIYHTILIPQVHRIDKELREDRIRMLLFVFKSKGERYVAVYPKMRFNSLMAELHRQLESVAKDVKGVPSVLSCSTKPLFVCKIPLYKGDMLNIYGNKKEKNMDEAINKVAEEVGVIEEKHKKSISKDTRNELIYAEIQKGRTKTEMARKWGLTLPAIISIVKKFKEKQA